MLELNGKCLAFHGPLLYEAKILRIWDSKSRSIQYSEPIDDETKKEEDIKNIPTELIDKDCYFIHYQGWKSSWDEWINNDRIKEYNDENVALRKKLIQDAKKQQQEAKRHKSKTHSGSNNNNSGHDAKKRQDNKINKSTVNKKPNNTKMTETSVKVNASDHNAATYSQQFHNTLNSNLPKIILHIPMKLKSILVDDWENVTKNRKICKLPVMKKENNITNILSQFQRDTNTNGILSLVEQSLLEEYINGIKLYFNECISKLLLYRLEKLQYLQLIQERNENRNATTQLCDIYGSVHLLRLLSILPDLMSDTTMSLQNCQIIIRQTESLLLWLVVHSDTLFDMSQQDEDGDTYYINTSSQYEGLALGM
ncbi:Esa1p-associated factor [Maudiozyma exigua]|uniref:Chromatin modification-related protein EAF3 n=1 Tax=Maudiozyma exigua TaxID=34358 RepID=A0A9P7BDC8_MAUEX|nr:Esa1p-associated factor [Kazachstania exigua]